MLAQFPKSCTFIGDCHSLILFWLNFNKQNAKRLNKCQQIDVLLSVIVVVSHWLTYDTLKLLTSIVVSSTLNITTDVRLLCGSISF